MDNTDESLIVDMLTGMFGDSHMHNEYKHQISFDCPVCSYDIKGLDKGDGKGNLEVNYGDHVFKCWACAETHNTKGHLGWLIERYGGKKDKQYYELIRPDEFVRGEKNYKKLVLPKEYHRFDDISDVFPEKRRAINYLKSRGITEEIIDKYDIGFSFEGDYAGRIIVPSYNSDGELNYFVSRSWNPKTKMKYKNPEADKEFLIFNESRINWEEDIWIVEGVFDGFFVPNSIPLLGKFLNDNLWEVLYNKAKKDIIICLDDDAWEDAKRLYYKLSGGKLYGRVKIVKLPEGKDLGDLRGVIPDNSFKTLEK